jgi:hypothetical protein
MPERRDWRSTKLAKTDLLTERRRSSAHGDPSDAPRLWRLAPCVPVVGTARGATARLRLDDGAGMRHPVKSTGRHRNRVELLFDLAFLAPKPLALKDLEKLTLAPVNVIA